MMPSVKAKNHPLSGKALDHQHASRFEPLKSRSSGCHYSSEKLWYPNVWFQWIFDEDTIKLTKRHLVQTSE